MRKFIWTLGAAILSMSVSGTAATALTEDVVSDVGANAGSTAPIQASAGALQFQTFTVGTAGLLSRVDVLVGVQGANSFENLTATIYGTNAGVGGDPFTPNTSSVLGSATTQPSITPSSPIDTFEMFLVSLDFASPISVSVGDELALGLTASGTTTDCPNEATAACRYNWGYENTGYDGGNAFVFNTLSSNFDPRVGNDYGFTTHVDESLGVIPLPAGLPLMLTVLLPFIALKRRFG